MVRDLAAVVAPASAAAVLAVMVLEGRILMAWAASGLFWMRARSAALRNNSLVVAAAAAMEWGTVAALAACLQMAG